MKILNLYAGIGGNRKLWDEVVGTKEDIFPFKGDNLLEVTAVEYNSNIAEAYQARYPYDIVVIGDAKQYLLDHYKEFDFIWISPPCQSHSTILNSQYTKESYTPKFPDMTLWQIISFLQLHGKNTKWVVENVKPYYEPLLKPSVIIDRHFYWSNFKISEIGIEKLYIIKDVKIDTLKDFDLSSYNIPDKRQVIRNQVDYNVGKYILECAINKIQYTQGGLF